MMMIGIGGVVVMRRREGEPRGVGKRGQLAHVANHDK